jgi:hypothetical protein
MDLPIIGMIVPFSEINNYRYDGVPILMDEHTGNIDNRLISHREVQGSKHHVAIS